MLYIKENIKVNRVNRVKLKNKISKAYNMLFRKQTMLYLNYNYYK